MASIDQVISQPVSSVDHPDMENANQHDWICVNDVLPDLIEANSQLISYDFASAPIIKDIVAIFDQVILIGVDEKTLRFRLGHRETNPFGRTTSA